MRLSSGPEHLLLTNRPVIVTQSDLLSSSPSPLQLRGSPYSRRSAAPSARSERGNTREAGASDWSALLGRTPLTLVLYRREHGRIGREGCR